MGSKELTPIQQKVRRQDEIAARVVMSAFAIVLVAETLKAVL